MIRLKELNCFEVYSNNLYVDKMLLSCFVMILFELSPFLHMIFIKFKNSKKREKNMFDKAKVKKK